MRCKVGAHKSSLELNFIYTVFSDCQRFSRSNDHALPGIWGLRQRVSVHHKFYSLVNVDQFFSWIYVEARFLKICDMFEIVSHNIFFVNQLLAFLSS